MRARAARRRHGWPASRSSRSRLAAPAWRRPLPGQDDAGLVVAPTRLAPLAYRAFENRK